MKEKEEKQIKLGDMETSLLSIINNMMPGVTAMIIFLLAFIIIVFCLLQFVTNGFDTKEEEERQEKDE